MGVESGVGARSTLILSYIIYTYIYKVQTVCFLVVFEQNTAQAQYIIMLGARCLFVRYLHTFLTETLHLYNMDWICSSLQLCCHPHTQRYRVLTDRCCVARKAPQRAHTSEERRY